MKVVKEKSASEMKRESIEDSRRAGEAKRKIRAPQHTDNLAEKEEQKEAYPRFKKEAADPEPKEGMTVHYLRPEAMKWNQSKERFTLLEPEEAPFDQYLIVDLKAVEKDKIKSGQNELGPEEAISDRSYIFDWEGGEKERNKAKEVDYKCPVYSSSERGRTHIFTINISVADSKLKDFILTGAALFISK